MSALGRLRNWFSQVRGLPARSERIDRISVHLDRSVADLHRRLDRLDRLDHDEAVRRQDAERLEAAAAIALTEARGRHQDAAEWTWRLEGRMSDVDVRTRAISHEQRVALELTRGADRDDEVTRLLADHRHDGPRRPGLSVLTITWNHAGWLPDALASAAEVLDSLDGDAGVHLILDDASSDETATVLERARSDPRVVVVSASRNLGLARARNVLLAACPTEHLVVLDADNRLHADGVVAVHRVARDHRPAIAWGQVVAATDDGSTWDAVAYAPAIETLRNGLCFDSMAVLDVEAVERIGGYSTDPQLGGVVDDYELLLRSLRHGLLATYVPVVLGHYRISGLRHSALSADHRLAARHVERMYLYDDPPIEGFAVAAVHPATGVLWAWPGARDRFESTDATVASRAESAGSRAAAEAAHPGSVLVLAPGGVDNLGDDAITWSVLDRVAAVWPDASVRVLTDRTVPPQRPRRPAVPVCWDGTLLEAWRGLPEDLLAEAAAGIGLDVSVLRADRPGPALVDPSEFDVVVVAGGGNLADDFAEDVMAPRLAIAAVAGSRGVPVVWSGQGVGPLEADRLDRLRAVWSGAAAVGVRDAGSRDLVGTEVGPVGVELVADDAASVPAAPAEDRDAALRRVGVVEGPYVVLHLRDAPYVSDRAAGSDAASGGGGLVDAVDGLARKRDASVVVLAVNGNDPGEVATARRALVGRTTSSRWAVLDVRGDPELAVAVVAAAEVVVAHSYHVALWSLVAGTPALLVADSDYYRAKAEGLGRTFGTQSGVGLDIAAGCDTALLASRLERVAAELVAPEPSPAGVDADSWLGDRLVELAALESAPDPEG